MGWLFFIGAMLVLIGIAALLGPFGVVVAIGGGLIWLVMEERRLQRLASAKAEQERREMMARYK